jgi:hypothetical protein
VNQVHQQVLTIADLGSFLRLIMVLQIPTSLWMTPTHKSYIARPDPIPFARPDNHIKGT